MLLDVEDAVILKKIMAKYHLSAEAAAEVKLNFRTDKRRQAAEKRCLPLFF